MIVDVAYLGVFRLFIRIFNRDYVIIFRILMGVFAILR